MKIKDQVEVSVVDAKKITSAVAIEDDYERLGEELLVYTDAAWAEAASQDMDRHDEVLEMDSVTLAALDPPAGLIRWAAARRWRALGEPARFMALVGTLLSDCGDCLCPAELRLALASVQREEGLWNAALLTLAEAGPCSTDAQVALAEEKALTLLESGAIKDGEQTLADLIESHRDLPELGLTLSERLVARGFATEALTLLRIAMLQSPPHISHEMALMVEIIEANPDGRSV